MREFELTIDELKNGLSPEKLPINTQFLYECLGFRSGKARLESHILLTNPLPGTVDMFYNWPFPQFITGEKYNFLIVRDSVTNQWDSVYSVSEDHLTVTHIFDVDELTFGKGTLMEVADFGEYAFMTNGVIMIYWDVALATWHPVIVSAYIPMMRTVCNFKGQAIGGNVVSSWYDCDSSSYIWSKIGAMDFVPEEDNESGYRRDPFGGVVWHTKRLGDFVVGYSSKGITFIFPVSDPVPTFGFKEACNIGIINQGACNGDLNRQVFVGEDYILREVTKEGVKELGYQEYIQQLSDEDIIVSYDPQKKDFYIGKSTKTFLLSPYGMTEVLQHPSAVWRSNKQSYMLPETVDGDSPLICTEPYDFGYRGLKTIFSIETDAQIMLSPEAAVDYSNPVNWTSAGFKAINDQGCAALIVSGDSFRFRLRFGTLYDSTVVSYLKVRYKMTDLRGMRGVYAPPTSFRGQR